MFLQHGKLTYALGLEWAEVEGVSPAQHLRELLGEGAKAYFQVVGSRREGQRVGFVREVPEATGKSKVKVLSLAATVAARGEDGIYFLDLGQTGWYAVVQGGELLRASGEMLMPLDHAIDAVQQLASTLDLPIYGSSAKLQGAAAFTLADLDSMRRWPAPMQVLGKGDVQGLVGAVLLLAVLAGIAYGGWFLFLRSPTPSVSPQQEARLASIRDYTQAMTAAMPKLNPDPAWLVDSYREAMATFPADAEGWVLDSMACTAEQCGATYAISDRHTTFSLAGMRDRFGASRVHLRPDGRSLVVTMDNVLPPLFWSAEQILDPPSPEVTLVDAHGVLRIRVPQVLIEQSMHRESLSQGTQPLGHAGIARETIVTSGPESYVLPTLGLLVETLGPLGFTPETFDLTTYQPGRDAMWRVTWARMARE